MFIAAEFGALNVEYIKEIIIKQREYTQADLQYGRPEVIVAVMNDGEERVLYECDTEEEAEMEINQFMGYMGSREKKLKRSHDLFIFGNDFCEGLFSDEALEEVRESIREDMQEEMRTEIEEP